MVTKHIRRLATSFRSTACYLTFFAIIVFGTVFSATASASWLVNGANLAEGTKDSLTTTATVDKNLLLKITGSTPVKVSCKGSTMRDENLEIIGLEEAKAKLLKFEGCETIEPATGCALESQPTSITTEPIDLLATPSATSPEGLVVIDPQTNVTLATIPFSASNTCSYKSHAPILGAVVVGAPTLQNESATQAIEGLGSTNNSNPLLVNKNSTYIEGGETLLKLTSGEAFSNRGIFAVDVPPTVPRGQEVEFTIDNISNMASTPRALKTVSKGFKFNEGDITKCLVSLPAGASCKIRVLFEAGATPGDTATVIVQDQNFKLNASETLGVA